MERAGEEARNLGHNYIGTGHLLLGLLKEREEGAVRALEALNITPDQVRDQVIHTVGYGADRGERRRPLTPRTRRALELAAKEALHLGHDHVGAGDILLGLVRESDGIAAQVLYRLGAEPDGVRREVARMLNGDQETVVGGTEHAVGLPGTTTFRARVQGLVVQVCCGVTDEELATSQSLRVDLRYSYEVGRGDDLLRTVDYGTVIKDVAELLERKEFRLLETGVRMVGQHVLDEFPSIQEVTVALTKLWVPIDRELSEVSVEATFAR